MEERLRLFSFSRRSSARGPSELRPNNPPRAEWQTVERSPGLRFTRPGRHLPARRRSFPPLEPDWSRGWPPQRPRLSYFLDPARTHFLPRTRRRTVRSLVYVLRVNEPLRPDLAVIMVPTSRLEASISFYRD